MRRFLDSVWFLPAIGLAVGGFTVWGLKSAAAPGWVRWICGAMMILASVAPALPFIVLLPWHFLAVRRGLVRRSRLAYAITLVDQSILVEHGDRRVRCELASVSRARRACNDNWTESKMLEDALGLFSANGRELVRVPISATGLDVILRELESRGVPVDDVVVSAPVFLD